MDSALTVEQVEAIKWLWENNRAKCGIIFEMGCDEHDTCEQRKKVREAFPWLVP